MENDGRRHTDQLIVEIHTILSKVVEPKITSLEKTVYGNGTPGLKTQVAIMWASLCAILSMAMYICKAGFVPSHLK